VNVVLRDLSLWAAEGIRIAVIQGTPEGGVYLGVAGDPATAEEVLGDGYQFPVACWCVE
jgi:hypothetical protein